MTTENKNLDTDKEKGQNISLEEALAPFFDVLKETPGAEYVVDKNRRVIVYNPEDYPPEVVNEFEGGFTVPLYLVIERDNALSEERKRIQTQKKCNADNILRKTSP